MRYTLVLIFLLVGPTAADDPPKTLTRKSPDPVRKLPDGRYQLGNVIIDPVHRTIELPGEVNMQEGLVELLACTRTGKTHESVLVLDIRPLHLQLALLALGLNAGRNPGVPKAPGDKRPPGDMVAIRVTWKDQGKTRAARGEELIYNQPQKRPMPQTGWVFIGSLVGEGVFGADETGSLITTYHDPLAILECPLETATDDTVYFANREVVPPVGTKVVVTIAAPNRRR